MGADPSRRRLRQFVRYAASTFYLGRQLRRLQASGFFCRRKQPHGHGWQALPGRHWRDFCRAMA